MHRLTFLPFRPAALLQPQPSAAKGRVVLLSRTDARMEVPDRTGRYLERPFRAAAHTLWRCLSVEWRDAGISVGLVAIDPNAAPPVAELARAIAGGEDEPFPVELPISPAAPWAGNCVHQCRVGSALAGSRVNDLRQSVIDRNWR